MHHRLALTALATATTWAFAATGAQAAPTTQIFTDPFTNASSQHATAVEPDTFAAGSTIVAATQSGRFFNGGSSGIGFATSTDAGATWNHVGTLPNITSQQTAASPYERVSDPSVAYDAAHTVWLVSSIPILPDTSVPKVYVSRSTDGGLTWGNPVTVTSATGTQDFDKNWTACDNTSTSLFYGHCYTTFDDFGAGDRLLVSTSTDGGLTWGPALPTGNNATGLGGQPLVQSNGTVIIPAANASETGILAYRSTNGGASWSSTVTVAQAITHRVTGNLRTSALPSAEIDGAGRVYVAWQDCRFRRSCSSNDIVISSSTDGVTWSSPARVPIDSLNSGADHFIPGLGVDRSTSASTARLGLTYYSYPSARCSARKCQLKVGFIDSADGGATWSSPTDVAGPMSLSQIADTSQGRMVGDYISTSWVGGRAYGAFAVGAAPAAGMAFNEALFVPTGGLVAASGGFVNTSKGEQPVANAASDHASPRSAVRTR